MEQTKVAKAVKSATPGARETILAMLATEGGTMTRDKIVEKMGVEAKKLGPTFKSMKDKKQVQILKDGTVKLTKAGTKALEGPTPARTDTKMAKALEILTPMWDKVSKGEAVARKDMIAALVKGAGMSEAGASTYVSTVKKRLVADGLKIKPREKVAKEPKAAKPAAKKKAASKKEPTKAADGAVDGAAAPAAKKASKPRVRKPAAKKVKAEAKTDAPAEPATADATADAGAAVPA